MGKISNENKNKVVNYICAIFLLATRTFNGDYKRKMNIDFSLLFQWFHQLQFEIASAPGKHYPARRGPSIFLMMSFILSIATFYGEANSNGPYNSDQLNRGNQRRFTPRYIH